MTGSVSIRHLANAGFLICGNGKKIIIDGIYGRAPQGFSALPDETLKALIDGDPPFDGVTHVLVSHYHKDHFDASVMREFLKKQQPDIWLPDDPRAARLIKAVISDAGENSAGTDSRNAGPVSGCPVFHLIPTEAREGEPVKSFCDHPGSGFCDGDLGNGDTLSCFVISHSGLHFRGIKVVCYALTVAGRSFLFLSDADFNPAVIGDGAGQTLYDIVFANPLFLDIPGGRKTLFDVLRAKEIVICHIPLPEDDCFGVRGLAERCFAEYDLPREKIRVLKGFDEMTAV